MSISLIKLNYNKNVIIFKLKNKTAFPKINNRTGFDIIFVYNICLH